MNGRLWKIPSYPRVREVHTLKGTRLLRCAAFFVITAYNLKVTRDHIRLIRRAPGVMPRALVRAIR